MKRLKKFSYWGLAPALALAPIGLAASCGSDSPAPTPDKVVAPDLNLLKQLSLQGNTHDFKLNPSPADVLNKITRLNAQGQHDPSGTEALRIEARVKAFNEGTSDKVNTEFMPIEILRLYLLNDLNDKLLTFTNGEVMFTLNGKTSSLKTVYGNNYGFTNANTQLPDFTGVLVNRDSIELRYAALPGYKLDAASAAQVAPQPSADFKEAVLISFSEKYFSTNDRKSFLDTLGFSDISNASTNKNLVYKNPQITSELLPTIWKPFVENIEFENSSLDVVSFLTTPANAVWKTTRPTSLPSDEAKRHIFIRLVPKNAATQEIILPSQLDIYGFLSNRDKIKVDVSTMPQYQSFDMTQLRLSWDEATKRISLDLGRNDRAALENFYLEFKLNYRNQDTTVGEQTLEKSLPLWSGIFAKYAIGTARTDFANGATIIISLQPISIVLPFTKYLLLPDDIKNITILAKNIPNYLPAAK